MSCAPMNPDDMYLQTFVYVCVYKKRASFLFPLSIHGILLGPTAAPPERGGRQDGGKSSLSPTFAALSRGAFCHARGISNQSQSQPSAGVLYVVEPPLSVVVHRASHRSL